MRISNYPTDELSGSELILGTDVDTSTQTYKTVNFSVDTLKTYINTEALAGNSVTFEGATADDHETVLTTVDPTADRTILLPNNSGTLALMSDVTGGGTYTGDLEINTGGTAVLSLRRDVGASTQPGGSMSMIQFNNSASTGVDDQAATIEALTDGGSANGTGGKLRFYTKIASSGNNGIAMEINNTQQVTFTKEILAPGIKMGNAVADPTRLDLQNAQAITHNDHKGTLLFDAPDAGIANNESSAEITFNNTAIDAEANVIIQMKSNIVADVIVYNIADNSCKFQILNRSGGAIADGTDMDLVYTIINQS